MSELPDMKVTHINKLCPPEKGAEIKFRCWEPEQEKMYSPEETMKDIGYLLILHNAGRVRLLRKSFATTGREDNGEEIYEGDIVAFEVAEGMVDDESLPLVQSQGPYYGTIEPAGDGLGLYPINELGGFLFSPYVNLEAAVWLAITEVKGNYFEDIDLIPKLKHENRNRES